MRNPDEFDPLRLGRYSVIRAHYEFQNERAKSKLFIVLCHIAAGDNFCWCIKPTTSTARYECSEELMKGVVLYEAKVLPFFPDKTVIDPATNLMRIFHSHLQDESQKRRYKIEGKMPEDFKAKLVIAIKGNVALEPKKMNELFHYINYKG